MAEARLRELFGAALVETPVERVRSAHEQALAAEPGVAEEEGAAERVDPYAGQLRLSREVAQGPVRRAEYDLFRGRVYRVRWRLSDRFERPLMEALVAHLRERLGDAAYDQTLEAKLGSGRAELRRSGWRSDALALEVRQLHPLTGGPLYLTLTDVASAQAIVEARGVALPQPESSGDWWRRPQRKPALLTPAEREQQLAAIDSLLAAIGFPPPAVEAPASGAR